MMSKGNISVQVENIFPIIKKFLYSDHEIFLRELISNAVDATTKVKTLASKGEVKGELGDTRIEVKINKEEKTLHIIDKGIGMSEDEVNKYLNQVAFSSAEEFLAKYKDDASIIGHFGLGFYSAFMVADKVQVITKSYRDEDPAVMWECEGNPEYTLTPSDKSERGTEIILHINEDNKEYLETYRVRELLNKYCKFLPVEIKFGTKSESTWEGEGDERKEIKTEIDDIINNPEPIWKKKPADLKDEDYQSFYSELYPMSQPPLFWIHLNIDYPFNLTGILYFPKLTNNFEIQKNKIQLYSNQVFITDDVKEIVPEFLMLLQGMIDSPDIPLNVSRSYLQSDANVKKINTYISRKVAEKLQNLFNTDRKSYDDKWNEISTFVKYGMISDEKFNEKATGFVLLKNIDGVYATLDEYKEKVKSVQTDKNNKIVYIYTNDRKSQYGYIQAIKDTGYDVLEMDTIIDNHFMQHLEYKDNELTFVRVDSDTVDNLIKKDESVESVLSQADQDKVKDIFTSVLQSDKSGQIELKAMSPTAPPVVITKPEFMRRMKEMQAMQGMDMHMFPEMHNVMINTNHPLIADKLLKMKSADKKSDFAAYLHDLALLNQGMLNGEELSKFIARSLEFVK
ncbi:MAG TPA: molecular chaperone HtpG [Saprospiraceae bacterium]|nr:molecular chaperone HtpG [Saprospiraceae bacterium]HRO72978.1 molecular chaperone HtpG [Saprospiraceae bacterium]HRP40765.1 molecular chaperone HtpG [Saprospiraceae bacterium]